ncbi:MAG: YncE family protein [Acidobacteriia bacterium]|nr:YncE family protein [Terriglobia bacterium]
MISGSRAVLTVLFVAILAVLVEGCGNTFRPTIVSIPGNAGDPASLQQAVVLSTNPIGPGSATHINGSGDTNVGVVTVGVNPVFLAKIGSSRAVIINGDQTLSFYLALLPLATAVNTVTQPANSTTAIAAAASSNGNIYVANSGTNSVTVVPGNQNVAVGNVTVDPTPVAVATNAASNKAYVLSQGGTVRVIDTLDSAVTPAVLTVGTNPIWAVASADGQLVFVVNQGSNSVSLIDTLTDTVVGLPIPTGASPNFAFYDAKLKRLYVNNSGENSITVIKADQYDLVHSVFPTALATIPLSAGPLPTSLTVLADGSRAYVARGGCPAGASHLTLHTVAAVAACTGNLVSVVDTLGLRELRTITVGSGAISIDSIVDSSRVYVVNGNLGTVSVIKTSTDSELLRIAMPQQDPTCTSACPLQTPFMVRTYP